MPGGHDLVALLASGAGAWGHPWGPGGGWMWLWGPLTLVFWLALSATVAWLVARGIRPRERSGVERAREILAERFARGELSSEEYRERLEQLRRAAGRQEGER